MTERKILFRGFYPDENGTTTISLNGEKIRGKWVYGYRCECVEAVGMHKTYPAIQQVDDGSLYFRKVLPETVGQWVTTDKNGKDVFEGDIISQFDTPAEVKYELDNCRFVFDFHGKRPFHADLLDDTSFELIGNEWESEATE